MKRALFLLALAACGDDRSPQRELPGTIWFVEGTTAPTLVRFAGGVRTTVARDVFPSPGALPDGRLVAVASRGDGSAESEQLVLVAPTGRLESESGRRPRRFAIRPSIRAGAGSSPPSTSTGTASSIASPSTASPRG